MPQGYYAFIGTNSVRGSRGIYTLSLEANGGWLSPLHTCPAYNTGALALAADGQTLYAASEGMTFQGLSSGGAMAYKIAPDGALTYQNGLPTAGQRPCCLAIDNRGCLLVANFFGGTLAVFPTAPDGSLLPLSASVHVQPLPGGHDGLHWAGQVGEYLGAVAVGRQALVLLHAGTLEIAGEYAIPQGYFPRHAAVTKDGRFLYLLMQNPGLIHVLENRLPQGGGLEKIQEISVIPPDYKGMYGTSTLHLTGGLLLAATRSADTIAVFRADAGTGMLTLSDMVHLPGETPRDFSISPDGKYAVTALQASDQVCVHEIDTAAGTLRLRDVLSGIPSPAAVAIVRKEALHG